MQLTDDELCVQFELKDKRTLRRWIADGCPHTPAKRGRGGHKRSWDYQLVKTWLKGRQARKAAVGGQDLGDVPPEIADRIRSATRPDELEGIAREVAALVALGEITGDRARAIKALLSESRALYKLVGAESESQKAIVATKEAYELVGIFEQIFDYRERKKVISAAKKALKADKKRWPDALRERPSEFTDKLKKERLNAWGDKS